MSPHLSESARIRRYSEVFDRGMALAQQAFEPERLRKIALKHAAGLKARPEWAAHLQADSASETK